MRSTFLLFFWKFFKITITTKRVGWSKYIDRILTLLLWAKWLKAQNLKIWSSFFRVSNPTPLCGYILASSKHTSQFCSFSTWTFGIASTCRQFLSLLLELRFWWYFRISSLSAYDNTGNPYNILQVVSPDGTLNLTAYRAYSPLYIPYVYI